MLQTWNSSGRSDLSDLRDFSVQNWTFIFDCTYDDFLLLAWSTLAIAIGCIFYVLSLISEATAAEDDDADVYWAEPAVVPSLYSDKGAVGFFLERSAVQLKPIPGL